MSSLRGPTHSLALGDLVVATVTSTNEIDTNSPSAENTVGAEVMTEPGKPAIASRVDANTTDLQIKISYPSPTEDGGSPLTSVVLYWDAGSSGVTWTAIHGDIIDSLDSEFIVTESVIAGGQHQFKHLAQNIFGDGEFSDVITIKAATKPD
jgi:hypothetical protein